MQLPTDSPRKKSKDRRTRPGWLKRSTVKKLMALHNPTHDQDHWRKSDERTNLEHRLAPNESVNLGGLMLVEAFTPSNVSRLYDAIGDLPGQNPDRKRERLARIKKSRSATGGIGWESLGYVRRPEDSLFSDGFRDPELPEGVAAVWLKLYYLTSSLAMVTATFTLEEDAGDLSKILRTDYRTEFRQEGIHMSGRFTHLRSNIPWARPKNFSVSHSILMPEAQKRDACENMVSEFESKCWRWFSRYFPGRFSAERLELRPSLRIYLTQSSEPFSRNTGALSLLGLGFTRELWRSPEVPGWHLTFDSWGLDRQRFRAIAAARRSDAAKGERHNPDPTSVWTLTQNFHQYQTGLFVRWATRRLLSIYTDRLSELRDQTATRHRIDRPVRRARELDRYLLGDGLDAMTVASEIQEFTKNLQSFRHDVVEYTETRDHLPRTSANQESSPPNKSGSIRAFLRRGPSKRGNRNTEEIRPIEPEARSLVPAMRDALQDQAARLLEDMRVTTDNIGASAELRQAIANTRMQRAVVTLAVIATLSSVLGIWLSNHS